MLIGTAFSLIGAISFSTVQILMRHMKSNIHYSIAPFYFATACTFGSMFGHFIEQNNNYKDFIQKESD